MYVLVQPQDKEHGVEAGSPHRCGGQRPPGGNFNTGAFVTEYERLRDSGMGVEQALIFTGHEFRLRQLAFRAAR
jgi:hypothetical protein